MGRLHRVAFKFLRGRGHGTPPAVHFDPQTTLHDFAPESIDGTARPLAEFAGKVVLVVNVASECGLTPQYEGLVELQERYGERGFVVLGFPCNQFKGQEPGTNDEIQAFCSAKYGVSFPLFSKLDVNGPDRHELYAWLTQQETRPEGPGEVQWNFGKFLVAKDGRVIARFEPATAPGAAEVTGAIEAAL